MGTTLGQRLGRPVQVVGGLVLVAIGAQVLVEHLML
jgi:putative Mn2+ efflux pump MntP